MNACELVTQAFYLSDVVSRDFETVSGSQLSDGMDMLNDILSEKSARTTSIPYDTHSTFNTVVGQESYQVSGLIEVSEVTYTDTSSNVRYSMRRLTKSEQFGTGRVENINSLPATYYYERNVSGGLIYLYHPPDQVYRVDVTGKVSFTEVESCTDVSSMLPRYYTSYLKYALSSRIADFYNVEFSQQKQIRLQSLERQIFYVVPPDMSVKKISTFNSKSYDNYAEANLSRGFYPS